MTQPDTLESMRARLEQLLPLQRSLRAELRELLKRAEELEPIYEKALDGDGPFPDDDDEVEHRLDVMRRLSAMGKEIIALMKRLPEYDSEEGDK